MGIEGLEMDSFLNDPCLLVYFPPRVLHCHLKAHTYSMVCKKEACDLGSARDVQEGDVA